MWKSCVADFLFAISCRVPDLHYSTLPSWKLSFLPPPTRLGFVCLTVSAIARKPSEPISMQLGGKVEHGIRKSNYIPRQIQVAGRSDECSFSFEMFGKTDVWNISREVLLHVNGCGTCIWYLEILLNNNNRGGVEIKTLEVWHKWESSTFFRGIQTLVSWNTYIEQIGDLGTKNVSHLFSFHKAKFNRSSLWNEETTPDW